MNQLSFALLISAMLASTQGFTTAPPGSMVSAPYFAKVIQSPMAKDSRFTKAETPVVEKRAIPKKKTSEGHGKNGPFAPVVLLAKNVLGDEKLNAIRGKAIGLHSKVIGGFVDTYETPFGETALRTLFEMADSNKNGAIEQDELSKALRTMGFDLKENQIKGIFERADKDGNGLIDYDEWRKEAPSTLRTNLIKLAKRNGGDLGFLA
jgi:EF-hand domain pair